MNSDTETQMRTRLHFREYTSHVLQILEDHHAVVPDEMTRFVSWAANDLDYKSPEIRDRVASQHKMKFLALLDDMGNGSWMGAIGDFIKTFTC